MKVSVYDAKAKLSQMINRALEGEEVVITRNGIETVTLVPVTKRKKWVGMYRGRVKILDCFFEPLDDETMAFFSGEAKTHLDNAPTDRK